MNNRELKSRIMDRYVRLVYSTVHTPSTERKLITGLEEILNQEIPIGEGELGPRLSGGKRLTKEEVLEMNAGEFSDVHNDTLLRRYVLAVGRHIDRTLGRRAPRGNYRVRGSRLVSTIREIVQISKTEALEINLVGDKNYSHAKEYFEKNYGIILGQN